MQQTLGLTCMMSKTENMSFAWKCAIWEVNLQNKLLIILGLIEFTLETLGLFILTTSVLVMWNCFLWSILCMHGMQIIFVPFWGCGHFLLGTVSPPVTVDGLPFWHYNTNRFKPFSKPFFNSFALPALWALQCPLASCNNLLTWN